MRSTPIRITAIGVLLLVLIVFSSFASGNGHLPGKVVSLPACETLSFDQVSPELWTCFKDSVSATTKAQFPDPNTGETSVHSVGVKYQYDTNQHSLKLTSSGSIFKSCASINRRITDYFVDCRGPIVTQLSAPQGQIKWRIDAPDVKQPDTAYSQIVFHQGDRVRVDAGGCVQTGGQGQTWRLYIDPTGSNSDRLYHGLIRLPGMSGLIRIRQFVTDGNNYEVKASQDMRLHLGYEDVAGSYANNGYWGHDEDDGEGGQCRNVGKAWIEITAYR